jgi:hypothetical protein
MYMSFVYFSTYSSGRRLTAVLKSSNDPLNILFAMFKVIESYRRAFYLNVITSFRVIKEKPKMHFIVVYKKYIVRIDLERAGRRCPC